MLVTSIFSFSHNVFKRFLFQVRKNSGLCGKELEMFYAAFNIISVVSWQHLTYSCFFFAFYLAGSLKCLAKGQNGTKKILTI